MTQLARPILATIAVLGIAGCSGGTSANPEPKPSEEPGSALANLDTCDIMTQQQLQQGGFEFTERIEQFDFEPGCGYDSRSTSLAVYKNNSSLQYIKENRDWKKITPIELNDGPGARGRSPNDTEDGCWTLFPAGGGTVLVYAHSADPREPIDGCAESLKIAQQIEPNLPE